MPHEHDRLPPARYISADRVIGQMAEFGRHRIDSLSSSRVLVLGLMAGAFITAGALFSIHLSIGFEAPGAIALATGFGFSTGFFFVVLSETALFTEANVVMPATLLARGTRALRVMRFWALAWLGNFAGAVVVGWMIRIAQYHSPGFEEHLAALITSKMQYQAFGGAENWFRVVLSGVLANWLVGMAAFFAAMGRTIIGKYIPVFLAVTLFVTAGFQHSPANMGYFAISIAGGGGPGWGDALLWNVIPAGIGNIIGGALLVAVPFWWIFQRR